ncbi:MAG: response regulator, partial [Pseudomonadota bacterium]
LNVAKLRFEIEDTGIGIADEKISQVFEKFSQADASASRKHEGTGLGLTISTALVELMDGEIGVESKQDIGSTFWFEITLPIHDAALPNRKVDVDLTGARVLVIDDNPVNRAILMEQMSAWEFDNAAAASGKEGLVLVNAAKSAGVEIDCIILDYHMPQMSGGDFLKSLRSNDNTADIPVVMLTSVSHTEDGELFSCLDLQGQLMKPARSALLFETLTSVLQSNLDRQVSVETSYGNRLEDSQMESFDNRYKRNDSNVPDKKQTVDVLVCEDNEVNQIVFTQVLQAAGRTYHIANNGQEGVEYFKNNLPQVILMDVSMPVMNGMEAAKAIRELEAGSGTRIPIIGVTAHALKGDMERCLESGMDDYLSKPVSPNQLNEKIDRWFGRTEYQTG